MFSEGAASLGSANLSQDPQARRRLRRGVSILPSIFTVGSLSCGYLALLATLRGTFLMASGSDPAAGLEAFDSAAKAIGYAIVFDGMDGWVARATNSASEFGREFDSLADVITFGVAPAMLAYAWGVRPVEDISGTELIHHLRQMGWIVAFAYIICGAARLARFNIQSARAHADHRYFVGLPIPGAAGVIAAVVHFAKRPVDQWPFGLVWVGTVALLAFLMVSKVRYYSFKSLDLRRRRRYFAIILMGLGGLAIWTYSEQVLLTLALVYVLSGPIARLVARLRPPPPPTPEIQRPPSHEVHAA